MTTLVQDARALRKLKTSASEATKKAKAMATEHAMAEIKFIDRLKAEGAEGVKTGGINFVPATTIFGQIQDRSEFVNLGGRMLPTTTRFSTSGSLCLSMILLRTS